MYFIMVFLWISVIPFVVTVLNHKVPGLLNLSNRDKKSMAFSKILEKYHFCSDGKKGQYKF